MNMVEITNEKTTSLGINKSKVLNKVILNYSLKC